MCNVKISPSGNLSLTIPSPTGGEHTVELPWTTKGMEQLRRILREQARATQRRELTLGAPASPSAYQIERFLVEKESEAQRKRTQVAEEILDIIGIDLDLGD